LLLHGTAVTPAMDGSAETADRIVGGEITQAPVYAEARNRQAQQLLATHLSRRYRIAADAAETLVGITYDTGQQVGLDPLLILAVMAVESRFNPIAESGTGAKGLMQVIPKYHPDKLGAREQGKAALYPSINIRVGTRVLKEYIEATGSLEAGLQKYNGALRDDGNHYAQKVLAERARYAQLVQGPLAMLSAAPAARASPASGQALHEPVTRLSAPWQTLSASRSM
jgi:soluble lytic murein transglycosylase-like protein